MGGHPLRRRHRARLAALVPLAAAAALPLWSAQSGQAAATTAPAVGFAAPAFVDQVRAGGEPLIWRSSKFGTLIYSSHEGTTHLYRPGIPSSSTVQFLCPDPTTASCYDNHVWIWTSDDNGAHWTLRDGGLTHTGFSDPDLTEDAAGNVYDTGIDLANEALMESPDGGKTWPNGTAQCHEGDRPWLAGGLPGEVFMETDDQVTMIHTLYHSSNFGNSCDSTGIQDAGTYDAGNPNDPVTWSGFGKGIFDHQDGSFIEPAVFRDSSGVVGVGISRLANASTAFASGSTAAFVPTEVVKTKTGVFSPFGAPQVISMDSAENLYFAWDSNEHDPNGTGGCNTNVPNTGGGPTPLVNHIWFVAGRHIGPGKWNFEKPISLAHQGFARVLWPWSVAGSPGNVSVVWYQMDQMVDPDCDVYNGSTIPGVKTYIYDAHIFDATNPGHRTVTVTNASGRFIHQGGICDSGTACVASGQDRRLGDYFTNYIDGNGCVIIASGDTTVLDPVTGQPRITSLPIFVHQNSGPGLTGKDCGTATTASQPLPSSGVLGSSPPTPSATPAPHPAPATLPNTAAGAGGAAAAGGLGVVALTMLTRRRRRGA